MFKVLKLYTISHRTFVSTINKCKKSVYLSKTNDIFLNLAFEDWLYRNHDFSKHHILLLWRSNPCVVIGRHQNPWLEVNVPYANNNNIEVVRRNSGGGTVYHDLGNLNLSFICPKESYNRNSNLKIISRAVNKSFDINLDISARDDLTINGLKVSGTAAKLGRPNSYHHCTLLVNADKTHMQQCLKKTLTSVNIHTNATKSIPSPVTNLNDIKTDIKIERLIEAVAEEYLTENLEEFQLILPNEEQYSGLNVLYQDFKSWQWRFGKTPDFTLTKTLNDNMKISAKITKGLVSEVFLNVQEMGVDKRTVLTTGLEGEVYCDSLLNKLENVLKDISIQSKTVLNF